MTAEEFRKAALALFGENGTTAAMAEALGVSKVNVGRWATGRLDVPEGVAEDITTMLRERRAAIDALLAEMG